MKKMLVITLCMALMFTMISCSSPSQSQSSAAPAASTPAASASTPAASASTPAASKSDWPTKAITVLEPYAAGSTSDLSMRLICSLMEKELGQPMVVKNVVGADGATCYTQVADAAPDGYTLGHVQHSGICIGVFLNKMTYSVESFEFFGSTNPFDHCVSVNSNSDIQNLDDLMEWAADQDEIIVAYSGYVNVFNAMNLFKIKGLEDKLVCIAYDDNPAQAVVSGDADVCVWQKAGTRTTAETGNLRIIAALATDRWPDIPDVPTAREQGYDVLSTGHAYFAAPAGLPADVHDKIQTAFANAIADPGLREQMAKMGWTNYYLDAKEATDYIYKQRDLSEAYLKELKMIE